MKKFTLICTTFCAVFAAVFCFSCNSDVDLKVPADFEKHELSFDENGEFKILQLTDIHWKKGDYKDMRSIKLIETLLEVEKPDLVVITGDMLSGNETYDPYNAMDVVSRLCFSRGIPWTYVFGNHDAEGDIKKDEIFNYLLERPLFYGERGPEGITGVGNFILEVKDGADTGALLYMIDSGDYSTDETIDGYGWIETDQIDWYKTQSAAFTAANGGKPYPALAFFHIPLPEYDSLFDKEKITGHKHEDVCCPKKNTGMYDAFVEMGDVFATFVGHDHANDFVLDTGKLKLCYSRFSGFSSYGYPGVARGGRVIVLKKGSRELNTWQRTYLGTKVEEK